MIGRSLSILFKAFVTRFKLIAFKCNDAVPSIIPLETAEEEEDDDDAYEDVKLRDMILSSKQVYMCATRYSKLTACNCSLHVPTPLFPSVFNLSYDEGR
tara:strand:- start:198 stop:494 length:297 start_codon:yes stop_codon:yes gene_type:complete